MTQLKSLIGAGLGLVAFVAGCFGPPDIPTELEVVLPADQRVIVQAGTGPEILAGSTWSTFREPDDEGADEVGGPRPGPYGGLLNGGFLERLEVGARMYRAEFDTEGRATRVLDNAFYLPEIFGTELVIDGQFHRVRVPALTFAAESFGVSVDNRFGIATPAEVRFLGIPLGTAVVYAWGTVDGDRWDGVFGFQADLLAIPDLLLGSGGDQYPFRGEREP